MKLRTLSVDFTANLAIDSFDAEVLAALTEPGYPVAEWITKEYHFPLKEERLKKTLSKINTVLREVLETRDKMLKVRTEA